MDSSIKITDIRAFETYINEIVPIVNQGETRLSAIDAEVLSLEGEIETTLQGIRASITALCDQLEELKRMQQENNCSTGESSGQSSPAYQSQIDMLTEQIRQLEIEARKYEVILDQLKDEYMRFSASKNNYCDCENALKRELPNLKEYLRIIDAEIDLSRN